MESEIDKLMQRERELEAADRRTIEANLKSGNASGAAGHALAVYLHDEVPPMLYRLWQAGDIDGDDLAMAIRDVWVQNPSPLSGLGERAWLRLFKAAGFFSVVVDPPCSTDAAGATVEGTAKFKVVADQPTDTVEAWRGASLSSKGRGMSWTRYRECAVPFAERWAAVHVDAGVFSATIPARGVLAVFGDEREQELVVNPNMLRGRVVLDETIPAQPPGVAHPLFPNAD